MKDKKVVVLFPGIRYSVSCPLLYYANAKFTAIGYEVIEINYEDCFETISSIKEFINKVENQVLEQLKKYDFTEYDEVVFVSKSIGTVFAGEAQEKLKIKATHILLTPIEETLPYINKEKHIKVVVAGTRDKHLSSKVLKEHCESNDINFFEIDGVGHRLECENDVDKSIDTLKKIVDLY